MAMGAPMKKGIDTALGSGTNFLYGRGITKSCGREAPCALALVANNQTLALSAIKR